MSSVLDEYNYFLFDVDRTIAPNKELIATPIIQKLKLLMYRASVAIVTSRSIHENLELFAQAFFQIESDYQLYFFTCSAGQCYTYDFMTGGLLKRYDKGKSDVHFQQYYQTVRENLAEHSIEVVDDVQFSLSERKAQIHERGSQITVYFSNGSIRREYELVLQKLKINFVPHALNTLHIVPSGVDKHLAIDYLSNATPVNATAENRFLIFADGFYDVPEKNGRGNDLAFTGFPVETVTCISVGRHIPKAGLGVFYCPNSNSIEWELTNELLDTILQGCSFEALKLVQT